MKALPLHDLHVKHGARFGEFAGFNMPLYYSKPIEEHHAVRRAAGIFDISHMGQFSAQGREAEALLQYALANDVRSMVDGQALYSPICREDGGVLDDLIVYRHSPRRYRIIVNAGNRARDFQWLAELAGRFDAELTDLSPETCLIAVQGPQAFERLEPHLSTAPGSLAYYHFSEAEAFGLPVFMARTGYTGEPGVELAVARDHAQRLWRALSGETGMTPIGLAARDTLRLEACMALYGHELREEWNPLECGVGWAVKLNTEEDFSGKEAIRAVKENGATHLLAGLEVTGRGIPREGYPVLADGRPVGIVTSGALSPSTGKAIALARVKASLAKRGTLLAVEIRGKPIEAVVTPRPFYKNPALRD